MDTPRQTSLSNNFVGRQREIGELHVALEDVQSGRGRLVMLVGEPGIGKTRIAQELASSAEQKGTQVLWGRCYEGEGAPPYWPWVQIIRVYIQEKDAEYLKSVMGTGASDMAEIIPQLREKLPDLTPLPTLESESARFRLFDAITTFLKNVSQSQPLLLILEDLHWADTTSLLLLEFLATELEQSHILVLGTYRDVDVNRRHPLSQTLGVLIREHPFLRIQLHGMTSEEIGQFIQITSNTNVPLNIIDAVHSRTEGNPLFVTEVVRLLNQEGFEDGQNLELRIPEGIRDAIGRRLSGLSQECNQVLTTASVIGREFTLAQLDRLMDELSSDELLDILEEALEGHVVEEVEGEIGTYRFTHALIQQTLASELSTTRRVRTHARIAQTLEELYQYNRDARVEELAHHYSEATAMLGPEKMVHYSRIAGEKSLSTYAWEDALAHFERALEGKEGLPMDDEFAAIFAGLGHALAALGEHEQAVTNLKCAFAYYAEIGDVARAVTTVEHPHDMYLNLLMKDTLSEALELVPEGSLQAARLLCIYGISVGARANGYPQGNEALEKSLYIAQREKDVALERRVLAASAQVDGAHMKWEQSLEKSLGALDLANQVDNSPVDKLRAYSWASNALYAVGDPTGSAKHLDKMQVVAESMNNAYWLEHEESRRRILAYLAGEWDSVLASDSRLTGEDSKSVLAMALYQTGDFDKGKTYMNSITGPAYSGRHIARWSIVASSFCRVTDELDLLTQVEAAARNALSNPDIALIEAWDAHVALAQAAILRHNAPSAAEEYAFLKLYPNAVTQTGAVCTDRILGLLAHAMGNLDVADAHFEDALAFCRKAGYRPELTWTCHDYSSLLQELGHKKQALTHLEEAISISTELGMKPLLGKSLSLKEQVEAQPSKAPTYPDGLTEREVEVLRLIAQGNSNREIGEELFISPNTVARHVNNIFSKTGTSNRAEAASYATRNNITS